MQGALRARALANSGVTATVAAYTPPGGSATRAIFWGSRPQNSPLTAVTLLVISGSRDQHMKGFQRMQLTRVQMDVWADTYDKARAAGEAMIAALAPPQTGNGQRFGRLFVDSDRDSVELTTGKDQIFRMSADLIVSHTPNP